MKNNFQEENIAELLEKILHKELEEGINDLIIFNDDVNTFDHVIETLMKVCNHSAEQAEQSALITHYKGKCTVKKGSFEMLLPMRQAICEAGIQSEII